MIMYDEMSPPADIRPGIIRPRGGFEAGNPTPLDSPLSPYPQPDGLLSLIGTVSELQRLGVDVKSLAGGLPPEKPFLNDLWLTHYPEVAQKMSQNIPVKEAQQYGNSQGNFRLREWAANRTARLTGKEVRAENLVTFTGSQYCLSAALLYFCAREGKVALTQTPTYSAFMEAADMPMNIPVVAVDSDEEGMKPDSLEKTIQILEERKIPIGLSYNMVYGNPDGKVMSDARGKQINEILKKHHIPLLLDYAYDGLISQDKFESGNFPHIDYLDENIILSFTAAKTFAPAERVAWAVIPDMYKRDKIQAVKQAQMIMSPPRTEIDFWEYAHQDENAFEAHIREVAQRYQIGIDAGMEAVTSNNDVFQAERPDAGMFLWVRVPPGLSTSEYLGEILMKHKVAYSPGVWFQPRQRSVPQEYTGIETVTLGPEVMDNYMRLCVVTEEPGEVQRLMNQLATSFREIAIREQIPLFDTDRMDDQTQVAQL